jgi:hypothetical protein
MPSCDNTDDDPMKTKRTPKFLKKLKRKSSFEYPKVDYPNEKETLERFAIVMSAKTSRPVESSPTDSNVIEVDKKALASIATHAWKAKLRLKDAGSVEDGGILSRVNGDIGRIWKLLVDGLGLEIKDHTGDVYDYGMPLRVVTSQPTAGITKERVTETLKPTIYWRNKIIQMGEVVIATPV